MKFEWKGCCVDLKEHLDQDTLADPGPVCRPQPMVAGLNFLTVLLPTEACFLPRTARPPQAPDKAPDGPRVRMAISLWGHLCSRSLANLFFHD